MQMERFHRIGVALTLISLGVAAFGFVALLLTYRGWFPLSTDRDWLAFVFETIGAVGLCTSIGIYATTQALGRAIAAVVRFFKS